jgi:hypothetical protein
MDVRGSDFTRLVESHARDLRYVVFALGDMTLALEMKRLLLEQFSRVGLAHPITHVMADAGDETLYEERWILDQDADRMAIAVNHVYSGSGDAQAQWSEADAFSQDSSRASADFIPAMLDLAGLTPEQALGRDTLTDDPVLAETLSRTEHLRWNAFHVAMGYTPMPLTEMEKRAETLAAAGQSPQGCRKDAARKQHACLVPWDELDAVSDAYNRACGLEGSNARDFKQSDRDIVRSVPVCLRAGEQMA